MPKNPDAMMGTIQWMLSKFPVQPNQNNEMGRENAPTHAGGSCRSGAMRPSLSKCRDW